MLHDEVVSLFWPGIEPVGPGELRDPGMLASAAARPFQAFAGVEAHASVIEKAAALFHSLISNHPFHNGNKRTAVIALITFLFANDYYPYATNEEMLELARTTATYRERGRSHDQIFAQIVAFITNSVVTFDMLAEADDLKATHDRAVKIGLGVRQDPRNSAQPPQ